MESRKLWIRLTRMLEEGKQEQEEMYKKHSKYKGISREEKDKDIKDAKTNENQIVVEYDLQAVLPSPSELGASDIYDLKGLSEDMGKIPVEMWKLKKSCGVT
nr:unnamed protein product [Callosobruchus chinensis]